MNGDIRHRTDLSIDQQLALHTAAVRGANVLWAQPGSAQMNRRSRDPRLFNPGGWGVLSAGPWHIPPSEWVEP
jgi:hypothetical protein